MSKEFLNKIQDLGFKDIYDFLLHLPINYSSNYLSTALDKDTEVVVLINVISHPLTFNKILKFNAFLPDFNRPASIIIFHPLPYHKMIFKKDKSLYVKARVSLDYGSQITLIQPLEIKEINNIKLIFKKSPTMTRIRQKHIEQILKDNFLLHLKSFNLGDGIAEKFNEIFCPSLLFVEEFKLNGGFSGEHLEAIKYMEALEYVLRLMDKKTDFKAKNTLNNDPTPFIKSLPFNLTKDQERVINELYLEFQGQKAVRRVIMGDVGSGKTIVILACAFIAYPKKSIVLVPTTILAEQIYHEAKRLLPPYFNIGLSTRGSTISEEYDFLIGTHALLFMDLHNFDLFMNDEQHKFGTKQRAKIEGNLSRGETKPHVVQFSATPIPRTLSLMQSNLVSHSFLKTLPFPKNIESKILNENDFPTLLKHIEKTIYEDKRQVAIIYPLIENSNNINSVRAKYKSIEESISFWKKRFNKVYSTYGADKFKEQIINDFKEDGEILIATTLFEVGISIPKLSTIIISAPELLGLATLHQLRGRVSRNGEKGYCFLMTKSSKLDRLEDFIKTNDGFSIAELDLKYRNTGDILEGQKQSGESFKYLNLIEDEDIIKSANIQAKEIKENIKNDIKKILKKAPKEIKK